MNGEEGGAGRAASVAVEGQEASKRKTEKKAKTSKQRNGQEPSYVVASGREVGEEKPSTGAEKTVKKKEKQTTEKGAKVETMREESPSRKSKGPIPLLNEVQSMEEETKEKKQKTEKAINGKQKKEMRGKRRTEVDADTSTAGPTVVNGVDPVLANEVDAAKEKDRNGKRKEKAGNETSAVPEAVPTLTLEGISTDASLSDHARNGQSSLLQLGLSPANTHLLTLSAAICLPTR